MQFHYGPLLILLAWPASPAFGQSAQAQDYPIRPVTLVAPYPAGGGFDVLARLLGHRAITINDVAGSNGRIEPCRSCGC